MLPHVVSGVVYTLFHARSGSLNYTEEGTEGVDDVEEYECDIVSSHDHRGWEPYYIPNYTELEIIQ